MRRSVIEKYWRQMVTATSLAVAFALGAVVLAQQPHRATGGAGAAQAFDAQPAASEEVEYLTRGPLHEAFAELYEADPVAAVLIAYEPPDPIEELPPEYRPEGENVQWIPGYWAWDDEREDFLWISGLWREIPPEQRWIPGYWAAADEGYQWVSGFWASEQVAEIEYLPMPPRSLEQGPSAPAPAENHFYIPGHWVYAATGYQWQPGFWSPVQQNWVWVPAQYVWTPLGVYFRPGYWDYDLPHRGVVFTPVYYRQPIFRSPRFVYRPRYTIDTGVSLLVHMFVRPNVRHYYFGDFYGPRYANLYQPWVVRFQQPMYYDPFFATYRHRTFAQTSNIVTWVNTQHQHFVRSEQIRPPRTIAAQQQFVRTSVDAGIDPTILRLAAFGESIDNVVREQDTAFTFRQIAQDEVQEIRQQVQPMRELVQMRQEIETGDAAAATLAADAEQTGRGAAREARARLRLPDAMDQAQATPRRDRDGRRQMQPATSDVTQQEAVGREQIADARDDLPPGREAMELTPEEQRDRRTDARAGTPPITGQTPAVGETPGVAEERPGITRERPGIAGPRRGVTGARPGVAGARPEDTAAPLGAVPEGVTRDDIVDPPGLPGREPEPRGAADAELTDPPVDRAPGRGTAIRRRGDLGDTPPGRPDAVGRRAAPGQAPAAREPQQPADARQGQPGDRPQEIQRPAAVDPQQRPERRAAGQRPPAAPGQGADTARQAPDATERPGRSPEGIDRQPPAGRPGARQTGRPAAQPTDRPGAQQPGQTAEAQQPGQPGTRQPGERGARQPGQPAAEQTDRPGAQQSGRPGAQQPGRPGQRAEAPGGPGTPPQADDPAGQPDAAADRRPGAAGERPSQRPQQRPAAEPATGDQPETSQPGAAAAQRPARTSSIRGLGRPAATETAEQRTAGQTGRGTAGIEQTDDQEPVTQRAGVQTTTARAPQQSPGAQQPLGALPGTDVRDPEAGQRMRGDLRDIAAPQGRGRDARMRPAAPEDWPAGDLRRERVRALPNRPVSDGAVLPGDRPAVGGAGADLHEGAIPQAGNLAPGGPVGVERGIPNRAGTAREREAQPFTLPDISDEEGLRQRRSVIGPRRQRQDR